MNSLITLPSTAIALDAVASSSAPMFNELLPIALFAIGFVVGGMIVYAIIHSIINGVSRVIGGRGSRYGGSWGDADEQA